VKEIVEEMRSEGHRAWTRMRVKGRTRRIGNVNGNIGKFRLEILNSERGETRPWTSAWNSDNSKGSYSPFNALYEEAESVIPGQEDASHHVIHTC
jgi:hypothetical protein